LLIECPVLKVPVGKELTAHANAKRGAQPKFSVLAKWRNQRVPEGRILRRTHGRCAAG